MDKKIFLSKYIVDSNGCWNWIGYRNKEGYGIYSTLVAGKQKKLKTYRISYEMHKGKISEGAHICHTCDNRACINPDHLYEGSAKTNSADAVARNRLKPARGEAHSSAKLTEIIVKEIREKHANGRSMYSLAREYGITDKHCAKIVKRKIWKHVTP